MELEWCLLLLWLPVLVFAFWSKCYTDFVAQAVGLSRYAEVPGAVPAVRPPRPSRYNLRTRHPKAAAVQPATSTFTTIHTSNKTSDDIGTGVGR